MTGARFGPLEIYIHCDHYDCGVEALVWLEGRDPSPPRDDRLPAGWTKRAGRAFCPGHS
jgi:hypothetical protein